MSTNEQVSPTIVIPTGASLSYREREAEWRDLVFLSQLCF
jgi:hypothetical protein